MLGLSLILSLFYFEPTKAEIFRGSEPRIVEMMLPSINLNLFAVKPSDLDLYFLQRGWTQKSLNQTALSSSDGMTFVGYGTWENKTFFVYGESYKKAIFLRPANKEIERQILAKPEDDSVDVLGDTVEIEIENKNKYGFEKAFLRGFNFTPSKQTTLVETELLKGKSDLVSVRYSESREAGVDDMIWVEILLKETTFGFYQSVAPARRHLSKHGLETIHQFFKDFALKEKDSDYVKKGEELFGSWDAAVEGQCPSLIATYPFIFENEDHRAFTYNYSNKRYLETGLRSDHHHLLLKKTHAENSSAFQIEIKALTPGKIPVAEQKFDLIFNVEL